MADSGKKGATIIIKKKRGGHGHGHHGGAWKVAFADFMTAMMAFFLVMWLMGSDEATKASIANYFNNPSSPEAWRPELADQDSRPLGMMTGAGESVLKGNQGEVQEDLIKRPQAFLHKESGKEGEIKSEGLIATEEILNADSIQFSVPERELFNPGSPALALPRAQDRLARMGLVSSRYRGKLQVRIELADGDYELKMSRVVAIKRYLVNKRWISEDLVRAKVSPDRLPASVGTSEPQVIFWFSRSRN